MVHSDIVSESPPAINIPNHGSTCELSIIDTTCNLTVPAATLVEPLILGHELMNFPTVAFLIKNSMSGRQVLFDLGCQKDFWNLPPPIAAVIDARVPGIRVDRNLVDILIQGGIDVKSLEAAIISHHHYDHIGAPQTFPTSMSLLVGPGFSSHFLPGYPTVEAPVYESAFEGRRIHEIDFSGNLLVAGYQAYDYFSDGSLYILNSPGHAIGHISALVRTTERSFVFLGGDICHFGGSFRPTQYTTLPAELSASEIGDIRSHAKMFACSIFTELHPEPDNARKSPFYKPCSNSDSWYVDPAQARQSIEHLKAVDADNRVLVLIAHDPSLTDVLPFFPNGTINNWYDAGWKALLRWRFLNELPISGKPRKYLVSGTYRDGKLVRSLEATVDRSSRRRME